MAIPLWKPIDWTLQVDWFTQGFWGFPYTRGILIISGILRNSFCVRVFACQGFATTIPTGKPIQSQIFIYPGAQFIPYTETFPRVGNLSVGYSVLRDRRMCWTDALCRLFPHEHLTMQTFSTRGRLFQHVLFYEAYFFHLTFFTRQTFFHLYFSRGKLFSFCLFLKCDFLIFKMWLLFDAYITPFDVTHLLNTPYCLLYSLTGWWSSGIIQDLDAGGSRFESGVSSSFSFCLRDKFGIGSESLRNIFVICSEWSSG